MGLSSIYLAQLTDQEPCRFQVDRPRPDAVNRSSVVTPLGDTDCLLSRRLLPRIRLPITGARPDAGDAPQLLLELVGPRLVATGDERRFTLRDPRQRRDRVAHAAQARWISGRTDEQEVVVHHDAAAHEIAAIDQ